MTNLGAEKSNNHLFKQSICWDPVPTLTYAPSFVPDVLFDLIGQSAIWRSVLSSRFNKIQTHKTVTIYTVCLLLRILLIQCNVYLQLRILLIQKVALHQAWLWA